MGKSLELVLALLLSSTVTPLAAAQPVPGTLGDTAATPEVRAQDIVSRMTLEEKAAQLGHTAPAIPRLGVPEYNWWNEGLHGVARAGIATVFPQAIGMAATWDTALLAKVGNTVATEFRAKFLERRLPDGGSEFYRGLTVWSPNINIFRDPRWGRGQETYGEDPYLSGRLGIAYIAGLQGNDPRIFKVIATSKHFAVHSGPESNRHREDVYPNPYDLEDTYLPAFRATVTEGKVQSVMCVYNAVNGVPGCASTMLMDDILRKSWGFGGYVVSDCGAAANIYRPDALHYTKTAPEGVAVGIKAGMDLICGDYRNKMTTDADSIVTAVKTGLLPQATVDRALERLFVARVRLGLFDPKLPFAEITAKDYDTPAHHAMSRKMAEESMVLLKNDGGLLPIKGDPRTIAVIGPNADSIDALVGNYYGTPSKPVTVLDGIRARYPKAKIVYAQGTGLIGPAEVPVPDAALCVDAACATKGLKAEYFAGTDLAGPATRTETLPNARLDWSGDRETSARWTGTLVAPTSGSYGFRFASENGYRVFVGDKLVVDEWGVGDAPSILTGTITLEKGRRYPIRVEGVQRGARSSQQLVWSIPGAGGDDAVAAAKAADLTIFVGGLSARIEGEEMRVQAPGFAGGDRTSLDLPAPQQALLDRLTATGKPLVLVLMNGSALAVNRADKTVPAIVEAWYPGGEGGHAVAGMLAGDFSPAGRLPVTFYKSADQLPAFTDYSMKGRTYRYFAGETLYPFGHGLSYTRFAYAAPTLSTTRVGADGKVNVSVTISNVGARDGDEVVQLYVAHPGAQNAPIRSLARFERVHLKKGETRRVSFTLDARALSLVDAKGVRRLTPGTVKLWIGGGQPGGRGGLPSVAGVATELKVDGQAMLPR
ncbi:glycoside hydrolase family 3 protein [Sphingomonas prati]|uniref:Beta-glucosidase n=1 Tax=Sphingomonas prati TaxID=1843237 RepID=A0A7W9BRE9_9SPHN|nr:glycoside hydrolase family 3 protein [Sphingomonas prati]MBB5728730.1 beta-glucosidase [Sphingomonas prati]GGE71566.1 glucan 1,4-alpha-glucosidase [Sphingomonas prati]